MTILWEFFPAKHMNWFIEYKTMIFEKKGKYPFIIANTDSSDKNSTHWWSILDIELQTDLFFFEHISVQWPEKLHNTGRWKGFWKNTFWNSASKNGQQNNLDKYKI